MPPAIQVRHLHKRFGKLVALRDISFSVEEGEIFGFLGPNGAGKSTLMSILTCQMCASSGEVRIFGLEPGKKAGELKIRMGISPQDTRLNEHLTARQVLFFYGALYGVPRKELGKRINRLLQLVRLEERAGDLVSRYSGGMKQRLNIALSLVHDPDILFWDEPTAGLDVHARHIVWDLIRELKGSGKTVVLATHDMNEAEILCDRVAIIDGGKLISCGRPVQLKTMIGEEDSFTLEIDVQLCTAESIEEALVESLKRTRGVLALDQKGGTLKLVCEKREVSLPQVLTHLASVSPRSIHIRDTSLEDVFLRLTGRKLNGDIFSGERTSGEVSEDGTEAFRPRGLKSPQKQLAGD